MIELLKGFPDNVVAVSCRGETTLPVLDVALATGFASSSQFARAYAKAFGEPPSHTRASA